MTRSIYLLILTCVCNLHSYGQSEPVIEKRGLDVHAGILGRFKYPGMQLGADYQLIQKNIDKERKNANHKLITKNRYLTVNVGYYHHKDYNYNLFIHAGYLLKRINHNGWYFGVEPKLGLSRTFIDAPVYEVKDDGRIKKQIAAGNFYFSPAVSFAIGKDLSIKNPNNHLGFFGKLMLYGNYPYNNFIYGRMLLEAGVSYTFNNYLLHSIKVKNKKK